MNPANFGIRFESQGSFFVQSKSFKYAVSKRNAGTCLRYFHTHSVIYKLSERLLVFKHDREVSDESQPERINVK